MYVVGRSVRCRESPGSFHPEVEGDGEEREHRGDDAGGECPPGPAEADGGGDAGEDEGDPCDSVHPPPRW
ncbi:MAG: hypothetical protein WAT69_07910 [Trichococcus flocculiformis]